MDFLAPIFAAVGLAAASVPVILHMLRRAPTQDMPFSIVRFLKPSQPKLTKRSRIEHWPLMLLRILALVLIGLAFARPFLREVIPLDSDDDIVESVTILVDRSASMRRDGVYDAVQKTIRETIDGLGDSDLLSVVTFSNTSTTLLSREKWATATADERSALIEGVVENYEPDWMHTDTGTAMRMAADELAQESKDRLNVKKRRLVVITDFQRGSNLDELKSGNWPAIVEVELKTVKPTQAGNVGVTFVADRRTDRTRVRVISAGDSLQQDYNLQPIDAAGNPVGKSISVTVAPGQRRSLILPATDPQAGKVIAAVELEGDPHPFDNIIDLPEVENPVVKVAHIGPAVRNDPESMRYFLQRVLDGNVERDVKLADLLKGDGVVLPIPTDVKFVVATQSVPNQLQDSLSDFFGRSGTLLVAPRSAHAVLSLKKFLPVNFEAKEADVDENGYAMLGQIDFDHPLFSVFSDARFADFSSIRFWRHRNLVFSEEDRKEGDWEIVAKFDSGLPAIAEVSVGESGRIILLAAGWQPDDSQLALSSRFAPLITRMLSLASPAQKDQLIQNVGDVIRPADVVAAENWTVKLPDGSSVSSDDPAANPGAPVADETAAVALPSSKNDNDTVMLADPGRYTVTGTNADGDYSVSLIAGISASESRTEMLPVGQLQVLGIGVEASVDGQLTDEGQLEDNVSKGQLSANELERKQKWWRWMMLAGLLCLVLESLWAYSIERKQAALDAGS